MRFKMAAFLIILALALATLDACRPALVSGFAIYLLDDAAPQNMNPWDLNSLVLQERPLLTSDDLVSYDAKTHEIELGASACPTLRQALPQPIRVSGVPFVVCAGGERIYVGTFWTPLSSLSFDGVVILQPCMTQDRTMRVDLGYPSESFSMGPDPRSDPRVLSALRAAGKLK